MNWIRKEKRLAIYLRDGLACCYCGCGIEDGVKLTLDHIKPHSKGGSNLPKNLITACVHCNSSRGNRTMKAFVNAVAGYINHGVKAEQILSHVKQCVSRVVDVKEAQSMMTRRGGFVSALKWSSAK